MYLTKEDHLLIEKIYDYVFDNDMNKHEIYNFLDGLLLTDYFQDDEYEDDE